MTAESYAIADKLAATVPDNPTVDDIVALHPEQEELIREMHARGSQITLSKDLRDEDGRPLVVMRPADTGDQPAATTAAGTPSVDDIVALHPEQEEFLREMHARGSRIELSQDLRDEQGRPLVVLSRNEGSRVARATITPSEQLPGLISDADAQWQSYVIGYRAGTDGASATFRRERTLGDDEIPSTPFVAPKKMTEVVNAALQSKRPMIVQHSMGHSGPFVTVKARWIPEGSDVPTQVQLRWSVSKSGTLRMTSAMASGYYRSTHDITAKQALALIEGRECFYNRDYAHSA